MEELERLEEFGDKVDGFQKKYNENSKHVAYVIGKNLTLVVCLLVPLLLVGFIWTEFGAIVFRANTIIDGVITAFLFGVGEVMMVQLGTEGGKLDDEYIAAKGEFDSLVSEINDVGIRLLGVFCDWQIDAELEQATRYRARQLKFTPKMWNEVKKMSHDELVRKFGKQKARKIQKVIDLAPIELNEAILLYDGSILERGALPESAQENLYKKSRVISTGVSLVFTALLTVSVAMSLTSDITLARVIYTVYKLTMLLFRMAKGYERGAKAYNTVEVKRLKAKSIYLNRYLKFMEEKTYLELVGVYDELEYLLNGEEKGNAQPKTGHEDAKEKATA